MSKYRWIIEKDHISGECNGVSGPQNYNPKIKEGKVKFELFDDDKILYYTGVLFGKYEGFEPLDDFGMPNAGCTLVKINGEWL